MENKGLLSDKYFSSSWTISLYLNFWLHGEFLKNIKNETAKEPEDEQMK